MVGETARLGQPALARKVPNARGRIDPVKIDGCAHRGRGSSTWRGWKRGKSSRASTPNAGWLSA